MSNKPSTTAAVVTAARGLATHTPGFQPSLDDPIAEQLLTPPFSWLVAAAKSHGQVARVLETTLRALTSGMVDLLALRTHAVDAAVQEGVSNGLRQMVIIGAGFDTRAFRLDALTTCRVFEIDRPATLSFKEQRLHGVPLLAQERHAIPADLSRTQLTEALADTSFNPDEPTLWLCEGMLVYLTLPHIEQLLLQISRLSPKNSRLLVTYMHRDILAGKIRGPFMRSLLARLGEPIYSLFTPQQFADLLKCLQFRVLSDTDREAWRRACRAPRHIFQKYSGEHFVTAEKLK